MKVRVVYCSHCGYRERAHALAAELRQRFAAEVTVEEGKLGQFDVLVDGGSSRRAARASSHE